MSEPPSVGEMRQSLSDLIAESKALRTDVKTDAQQRAREMSQRRRENHINIALLGLLALFTGVVLVVAWQNNQIARQTADTNQRMADCTTPGGKCYEQGTARTGDAIGSILRAQIAVSQCARLWPNESGPAYDVKVQRCVYERVAAGAPSPTPGPSSPSPVPSSAP